MSDLPLGRDALIAAITQFLAGQEPRVLEGIRTSLEQVIDEAGRAALIRLRDNLEQAGTDWSYYPADPLARRIHHVLADWILKPGSELLDGHRLAPIGRDPVVIFANHLSYSDANLLEVLLHRAGTDLADRLTVIAGPKVYSSLKRRFSSLCFGTIKTPQSSARSSEDAVMNVREVARAARRSIEIAHERLRRGDALLVFAEGTRSRTRGLQRMLAGVTRYLEDLDGPDVWVLPAAIVGTDELFPIGGETLYSVRCTTRVGDPIRASVLREQAGGSGQRMMDRVGFAIAELLPPEYRGVYADQTADLDQEMGVRSVNSRGPSLRARLLAAAELLETVAADRGALEDVPPEERERLFRAAALVYSPDRTERRRRARAAARAREAARAEQQERALDSTGIRALRREPVFRSPVLNTPNIFPPRDFEPNDVREGHEDGGHEGHEGAGATKGTSTPSRHCYICKAHFTQIHHFYDQLCPGCADLNFAKRTERADLRGRVALVTGARVKIGYQAALKLLRCGAHVLVTTRFPRDAALRYAREDDFDEWRHRLEIFGLDLRHTPSVEALCQELLATRDRLDFIVNNACQTVRRPPAFYAHLMAAERAALAAMPPHVRELLAAYERLLARAATGARPEGALKPATVEDTRTAIHDGTSSVSDGVPVVEAEFTRSSAGSGVPYAAETLGLVHAAQLSQAALVPEDLDVKAQLFPEGRLDQDLQQVDLRGRNSWRLFLADVSTVELLEVHLVNAVAPFILNARLKALMLRTPERDKHIVNVSAVEGQFYRRFKTTRHPHTNMAKAALNMMTRTSAAEYHGDGIHMNSVDTGWVTDEDPAEIAARKAKEQRFHPPLDIVDGAARILDPIIDGINTGRHVWGQFLKDYRPTDW